MACNEALTSCVRCASKVRSPVVYSSPGHGAHTSMPSSTPRNSTGHARGSRPSALPSSSRSISGRLARSRTPAGSSTPKRSGKSRAPACRRRRRVVGQSKTRPRVHARGLDHVPRFECSGQRQSISAVAHKVMSAVEQLGPHRQHGLRHERQIHTRPQPESRARGAPGYGHSYRWRPVGQRTGMNVDSTSTRAMVCLGRSETADPGCNTSGCRAPAAYRVHPPQHLRISTLTADQDSSRASLRIPS